MRALGGVAARIAGIGSCQSPKRAISAACSSAAGSAASPARAEANQ